MSYVLECDYCWGDGKDEDGVICVPCAGTGDLCGDCDMPFDECKCEVPFET